MQVGRMHCHHIINDSPRFLQVKGTIASAKLPDFAFVKDTGIQALFQYRNQFSGIEFKPGVAQVTELPGLFSAMFGEQEFQIVRLDLCTIARVRLVFYPWTPMPLDFEGTSPFNKFTFKPDFNFIKMLGIVAKLHPLFGEAW